MQVMYSLFAEKKQTLDSLIYPHTFSEFPIPTSKNTIFHSGRIEEILFLNIDLKYPFYLT